MKRRQCGSRGSSMQVKPPRTKCATKDGDAHVRKVCVKRVHDGPRVGKEPQVCGHPAPKSSLTDCEAIITPTCREIRPRLLWYNISAAGLVPDCGSISFCIVVPCLVQHSQLRISLQTCQLNVVGLTAEAWTDCCPPCTETYDPDRNHNRDEPDAHAAPWCCRHCADFQKCSRCPGWRSPRCGYSCIYRYINTPGAV